MCQPDADARSSGQCALGRCTQLELCRSSRWLTKPGMCSVDIDILHNALHQYGHADLHVCVTSF